MALGALSRACVAAEASLPLGWHLIGVWRDKDAPGKWMAVANGDDPAEMATGKGDQPEKALRRLAEGLRESRGWLSG